MIKLTRSQEREEKRALGKGLRTSVFGLILCWVPLLGMLLASIGYVRINKRITNAHRARQKGYLAVSLIVLLLCTFVLVGEAYIYTHDPYVLDDVRDWVLDRLTDGGYYTDYYYYDDTYQDYNAQYYYNEGAYTYQEDYAGNDFESE